MSAFPTHKTLASVPVTQDVALKFLSSYLAATKTTPYLLPNARLEPSGPTAGSNSALTIHNLQRVEAGLRGEWLEPILDLEESGTEKSSAEAGNIDSSKMEVDGWQDLDEYQREQSIEEGEVEPRQTGVLQEGDSELEGRVEVEVDAGEDVDKSKKVKRKHENSANASRLKGPVDKEAKKKAKKDRLKIEKKKRREQLKAKDAGE